MDRTRRYSLCQPAITLQCIQIVRPDLFTILLATECLAISRYALFLLSFCFFSWFLHEAFTCLCSPLAGGPLLSSWWGLWDREPLFPSHLFHYPWHRFLWLAMAWPWSGGPAARCAVRQSGLCTTLLPALSGNLPVWVAKCAHYAGYYHIAALGEAAKCSGVWYAVRYPCTPGCVVCLCLHLGEACLCLHLGEVRSRIQTKDYKIRRAVEFSVFLRCHCYCGERGWVDNPRIYPVYESMCLRKMKSKCVHFVWRCRVRCAR